MKDTSLKRAAAQRNVPAVLAVVVFAVFVLTYALWPRWAPHSALLSTAAALLLIWVDVARRSAVGEVRRQTLQQGAVAELGQRALSGVGLAELSNVAVSVVAHGQSQTEPPREREGRGEGGPGGTYAEYLTYNYSGHVG